MPFCGPGVSRDMPKFSAGNEKWNDINPPTGGLLCFFRSWHVKGTVGFYPVLGEGSPTKIDYRKKRYSTGGPSI